MLLFYTPIAGVTISNSVTESNKHPCGPVPRAVLPKKEAHKPHYACGTRTVTHSVEKGCLRKWVEAVGPGGCLLGSGWNNVALPLPVKGLLRFGCRVRLVQCGVVRSSTANRSVSTLRSHVSPPLYAAHWRTTACTKIEMRTPANRATVRSRGHAGQRNCGDAARHEPCLLDARHVDPPQGGPTWPPMHRESENRFVGWSVGYMPYREPAARWLSNGYPQGWTITLHAPSVSAVRHFATVTKVLAVHGPTVDRYRTPTETRQTETVIR